LVPAQLFFKNCKTFPDGKTVFFSSPLFGPPISPYNALRALDLFPPPVNNSQQGGTLPPKHKGTPRKSLRTCQRIAHQYASFPSKDLSFPPRLLDGGRKTILGLFPFSFFEGIPEKSSPSLVQILQGIAFPPSPPPFSKAAPVLGHFFSPFFNCLSFFFRNPCEGHVPFFLPPLLEARPLNMGSPKRQLRKKVKGWPP